MNHRAPGIGRMCAEMLGLATLMGLLILIAAYHRFDGFSGRPAEGVLVFCVVALFLATLVVQAYASLRIARLEAEKSRLQEAATRDGLTRVMNRTGFKAAVERELALLRRRPQNGPFTLLIIDADHFKRINDRLGHATGDHALSAIAATLTRSVRTDDIVGRIGGEEFAILLRKAGYEEAMVVAERLRLAIHRLAVGSKRGAIQLSVSVGGITFKESAPYDAVYRAADANLYRAKRNGRNRTDLSNLVRAVRRRNDMTGATRALAGTTAPATIDQPAA